MQKIDDKAWKCPHCHTNQRSWFKRHKVLTGIFGLFLLGVIGISASNNTSKPPNISATTTPIADDKWISDAGQRYYDSHKDLQGEILNHEQSKDLMSMCISDLKDKDKCEDIIAKKFWIGMSENWAVISMGNPNDINTTTVSGLTRKQYVYGNPIYGATYVYFDNEVLTSYQQ
jgi:hypothetical protein